MEPIIASVNWIKSVIIIALIPPNAEYASVIEQAIARVTQPGNPNTISPNFTAAKLTAPITNTLNTNPKYNARNPRKNAAGFPL